MFKSQVNGKVIIAKLKEQLFKANAEVILEHLPERIRSGSNCATEIEYPVEAVIKMVIASFLDTKALSFADYKS